MEGCWEGRSGSGRGQIRAWEGVRGGRSGSGRVLGGQIRVREGPGRSDPGSGGPSGSSFRVWDGEDPAWVARQHECTPGEAQNRSKVAKTGYFWPKRVNFQRPTGPGSSPGAAFRYGMAKTLLGVACQHECTPQEPPESGKTAIFGQKGVNFQRPGARIDPPGTPGSSFSVWTAQSMPAVDSSMSAPGTPGTSKTAKTGQKRVNFQRPSLPDPPGPSDPGTAALMLLSTASTLFAIPYQKAASRIGPFLGLANKNAFLGFLSFNEKVRSLGI